MCELNFSSLVEGTRIAMIHMYARYPSLSNLSHKHMPHATFARPPSAPGGVYNVIYMPRVNSTPTSMSRAVQYSQHMFSRLATTHEGPTHQS